MARSHTPIKFLIVRDCHFEVVKEYYTEQLARIPSERVESIYYEHVASTSLRTRSTIKCRYYSIAKLVNDPAQVLHRRIGQRSSASTSSQNWLTIKSACFIVELVHDQVQMHIVELVHDHALSSPRTYPYEEVVDSFSIVHHGSTPTKKWSTVFL